MIGNESTAHTAAGPVKVISGWTRDPEAYDPSAQVCVISLKGETFKVRALRGEQWPMVVRRTNGDYVATVGNWRRLPRELAAHLADSGE